MSTSILPAYPDEFADAAPPEYSRSPQEHEQTLESTTRRRHLQRTGSCLRKFKNVTVIFTEQDRGCDTPSYGRQDVVRGEIGLERPEDVLEVSVKV